MNLRHRIAHLFGWNYGHVVSAISDGYIWVGFQCETCGCISGRYPALGLPNHLQEQGE
jgi:hypothetical protein